MKLYKLTKQDGTTYKGYFYGEIGLVHTKPVVENPQLCSSNVFHAYKNKNLALLLNPIHADISNPILWEIQGDVVCNDFGKVGSFKQKVIKKLELPEWYLDIKIRLKVIVLFAQLCSNSAADAAARAVARAAADAADASAYAAARAVARAAAYAADAAAYAADAAAYAADAAAYAAHAAHAAAYDASSINFCKLADKAVKTILSEV